MLQAADQSAPLPFQSLTSLLGRNSPTKRRFATLNY